MSSYGVNTKVLFDGLEHIVRATDHARRRGADLHVVRASGVAAEYESKRETLNGETG
jgi:hypothetical protein